MHEYRYFLFDYTEKDGTKMQNARGFTPGGDPVAYGDEFVKQGFWRSYTVRYMSIGETVERR